MMADTCLNDRTAVIALGASGRLGEVLYHFWPSDMPLLRHSRRRLPGYLTSGLIAPRGSLRRAAQQARAIVCLAGVTPQSTPDHAASFSQNAQIAIAAIKIAHDAGVPRIFLISSAAVYGSSDTTHSEAEAPLPGSAYGRSKYEMEQQADDYAMKLGQPLTILRLGNVVGCDALVGRWRPDCTLDTLPDGSSLRRSYIGPMSFARVLADLCRQPMLPKVINLSMPGTIGMGDLLTVAGLSWRPRNAPDDCVPKVHLCTRRLARHVALPKTLVTAQQMIAEWHLFQRLRHLPEQAYG